MGRVVGVVGGWVAIRHLRVPRLGVRTSLWNSSPADVLKVLAVLLSPIARQRYMADAWADCLQHLLAAGHNTFFQIDRVVS